MDLMILFASMGLQAQAMEDLNLWFGDVECSNGCHRPFFYLLDFLVLCCVCLCLQCQGCWHRWVLDIW